MFQSCVEWAADARFTDEDVAQAKLSLFSSIDAPLPPSSRGLSLFTNGLSDQSRQQFRNGMICPFPMAALQSVFCADVAAGLLGVERAAIAAACSQLAHGGVVCAAGPEER